MECNIYAHHQIKTVFLYFLLGENGIKQQPQHKIFFQQLPMIKAVWITFIFQKGVVMTALQDFSQIEKADLKNF